MTTTHDPASPLVPDTRDATSAQLRKAARWANLAADDLDGGDAQAAARCTLQALIHLEGSDAAVRRMREQ